MMENRKIKIENQHQTDGNREKFVQDFNRNVLSCEKMSQMEESGDAFKMERTLEDGRKIDIYTLRGGDFNILAHSPFLGFMNAHEFGNRSDFFENQENILQASKMSLDEARQTFGFGNNYISTSLLSNENLHGVNWESPWSFGFSQIEGEDLINGGTSDQWTLGEATERGETSQVSNNLFNEIHFDDGSYNEIAIWRYKNGVPRKPDFIITDTDSMERFKGENIDWAVKAATEFKIPVVIIDKEAMADEKDSKILEAMEKNLCGEISDMDFLNVYLRGSQSFNWNYSHEQKLFANRIYSRHIDGIRETIHQMRENSNFENAQNSQQIFENLQNMRELYSKRDAVLQSWSDAFLMKSGLQTGYEAFEITDEGGGKYLDFRISESGKKLRRELFEAEVDALSNALEKSFEIPAGYLPFLKKVKVDTVEVGGENIELTEEFWLVNLGESSFRMDEFRKDSRNNFKRNSNFIGDVVDLTNEDLENLKILAQKIEKR